MNLPQLSDYDKSLIKKIDQNYSLAESLIGSEPLIWHYFNLSPPERDTVHSNQSSLSGDRKQAFQESNPSPVEKK